MALEYESLNAVIPCELALRLSSWERGGRDDFSRVEVEENFMRSKEADTVRWEYSNEGNAHPRPTNPVLSRLSLAVSVSGKFTNFSGKGRGWILMRWKYMIVYRWIGKVTQLIRFSYNTYSYLLSFCLSKTNDKLVEVISKLLNFAHHWYWKNGRIVEEIYVSYRE